MGYFNVCFFTSFILGFSQEPHYQVPHLDNSFKSWDDIYSCFLANQFALYLVAHGLHGFDIGANECNANFFLQGGKITTNWETVFKSKHTKKVWEEDELERKGMGELLQERGEDR